MDPVWKVAGAARFVAASVAAQPTWDNFCVGLGPPVGNVADGGRDRVFVSYSHSDEAWARRFKMLLKPLVRSKRLRLWVDTDIRVGDKWHPDIIRAIGQSSLALLLVSADFLDSDFIMEQELPALIGQRVRLASVLVGDCLWEHVPELASVKWLHDPGRDGALNLVADQPGQRDRRLREICDQLIALAPDARGNRSLGYDSFLLPADSPLGYDSFLLPADSSLSYDPPLLPAGSKNTHQQAIDSGDAKWAPKAAVHLGLLLTAQGDAAGARAAYQRAMDSGHAEWAPAASVLLGLLLAKQGDAAGARAAYQRAMDSGHAEWAPKAAAKLRRLK